MSSLTGNSHFESLDGSVGVHAFTTASQNLGALAAATNLRNVAFFSILSKNNTLASITSITDSEGKTWTRATSASQTGINNPGGLSGAPLAQGVEIWYTNSFLSSSIVTPTAYTITINTDNDVDSIQAYYSIHKDIDTSVPKDQNASLPDSNAINSAGTAKATLSSKSTNTNNIQVCVVVGAVGPGQRPGVGGDPSVGADTTSDYGQSDTFHLNQNYNIFGAYVYDETAALSGVTIQTHDATNNQIMAAYVFTQDAQALPSRSFAVVIS